VDKNKQDVDKNGIFTNRLNKIFLSTSNEQVHAGYEHPYWQCHIFVIKLDFF
jgi:hypothetical protein